MEINQTYYSLYFVAFACFMATLFISCKKNDDPIIPEAIQSEQTFKISEDGYIDLNKLVGGSVSTNSLRIENEKIIRIQKIENNLLILRPQEIGETVLYYRKENDTEEKEFKIKVTSEKLIRILAIGNSFSRDAVEQNLHELGVAVEQPFVIGHLSYSGASLEFHLQHINLSSSPYRYTKINLNGDKSTTEKFSISQALINENWDFITLQQSSARSGMSETFSNTLPTLHAAIDRLNPYPKSTYALHQTWAYAPTYTSPNFAYYNNDQMTMYNAIVFNYQLAKNLIPGSIIIPTGTAIQNARTTQLGYDLTRDGSHLDLKVGRYIAACTWFEALTKTSVLDNPYRPKGVSSNQASIAHQSAHFATKYPLQISEIE